MKRKGCSGCGWFSLLFLLGVLVVPATLHLLWEKWKIHELVAHARSIRLEQFRSRLETMTINGEGKEEIIASKNLTPGEFFRVSGGFPLFVDVGFSGLASGCLFNPHHRILITDEAGNVTTIEVCFECDHVKIESATGKETDYFGTPLIWQWSLRRFFAAEGMADSPGHYRSGPGFESTNAPPIAAPR